VTDLELLPGSPATATLEIGTPAPAFEGLLGVDGRRYGTSDFASASALVLIFSSNRCPTAKAYGKRLNALQAAYRGCGVQVVALNSNDPHLYPDERYERMIERAAEDGYTFPYLVDDGQDLARAFGATCTFHVFVLDRARRLRYEGRFDDARLEERVTRHDVADVLDDLLADRPVRVTSTLPFGCSLDFTSAGPAVMLDV
jgi:peroxiredoxin